MPLDSELRKRVVVDINLRECAMATAIDRAIIREPLDRPLQMPRIAEYKREPMPSKNRIHFEQTGLICICGCQNESFP
jgi:hypothetical protein